MGLRLSKKDSQTPNRFEKILEKQTVSFSLNFGCNLFIVIEHLSHSLMHRQKGRVTTAPFLIFSLLLFHSRGSIILKQLPLGVSLKHRKRLYARLSVNRSIKLITVPEIQVPSLKKIQIPSLKKKPKFIS